MYGVVKPALLYFINMFLLVMKSIAGYYSNSVNELFSEGYVMIRVIFMAKETFSSTSVLEYLCCNSDIVEIKGELRCQIV